jgi:hypothetical protein
LDAHFDVCFFVQHLHHAFAKQRMIVNDEHVIFFSILFFTIQRYPTHYSRATTAP